MDPEDDGFRAKARRGRDEVAGLGEEMAGIAGDLRQLAATEVQLAKAELGEQVGLARNIAIAGGIALVAAMLGLVFVFVTIMVALAAVMPWPAAALLTTVILFVLAGLAGLLVYTWFKRLTVVPKTTIRSVREDVRWAKEQLRSSVS